MTLHYGRIRSQRVKQSSFSSKMFAHRSIARRSCLAYTSETLILCRPVAASLAPQTIGSYQLSIIRFFGSQKKQESAASGEFIHDYFKEKKLSLNDREYRFVSRDDSHSGLLDSLDALSHDVTFSFDTLDPKSIKTTRSIEDFVLSAPRYPKASFSTDGNINVSLARRGHYSDFIREARYFRAEEVALSTRLYPARRSRGRVKDEARLQQLQRSLDENLPKLIEECSLADLIRVLRQMYSLGLSIRANQLSILSRKLLKMLHSMSFKELVETAFLLRSYMGSNPDSCRLVLCAIAQTLEKRCGSLLNMSPGEVLVLLIPAIYMQIHDAATPLRFLNNRELVEYLVSNVDKLDADGKADLFTLLNLSSTGLKDSNISEATKDLVSQLEGTLEKISDNALDRLLSVSTRFESEFPQFSSSLYKHALTRSRTLKPTVLSSAYLKLTDKTDLMKKFEYEIGKRFVEISTDVLVELYCRFMQDGSRSIKQQQNFEKAFEIKRSTLSMRNISTILMYQSMYGRNSSRVNDIIRERFLESKIQGKINNDELLDVVLSMSMVGMHNNLDIWSGIDLPHLVYSTPQNILVYLGYCLLITGERNKLIWNILFERMLHESKTHTAETYEVLKIAKILGIMGPDTNERLLRRAASVLQSTKSQHYAKVYRQRHQPEAPIDRALDLMDLQYSKGVMIEELYEAPYYIKSHKIILDPLRDSYLHRTTGLEVGEIHLRHSVWRKQGYQPFPLNDIALRRFHDSETGEWNVVELSNFICKVTKLDKHSPLKKLGRVALTKVRKRENQHASPLKASDTKATSKESTIHRLRRILLEKNYNAV